MLHRSNAVSYTHSHLTQTTLEGYLGVSRMKLTREGR